MKKVLFATTALVASAGFASAEVSLSGSAEMAVVGGDFYAVSDTAFHSNVDVSFKMSGETDGGLTFGAKIDLDEATRTVDSNESVFISGAFGTLTMGDTDNAFDKALTELAWGATIRDEISSHAGFESNTGIERSKTILRYDYSFGDITTSVSVDLDDTAAEDDAYAVGVAYSGDLGGVGIKAGVGHNWADTATETGVSLVAEFAGGFSAGVNYSTHDDTGAAADWDHFGIGVAYEMDALIVEANYGEDDNKVGADADSFALGAGYDLGGATLQFGYTDDYQGSGDSAYSFGVAMSF